MDFIWLSILSNTHVWRYLILIIPTCGGWDVQNIHIDHTVLFWLHTVTHGMKMEVQVSIVSYGKEKKFHL